MPDGVTLIPPDALTSPQGTQLSPAQGNASNSSMARLTEDAGGTGALSAGYPWIPALLVGCGMVAFLSLSFYSHHKRVRRKREVLMDYLSVLIQSGALARGRSVSILCNTNSLALSQLGKSFRISRDRNGSVEASDILRDRYFKDLSELSNSHKKTRNILRRFISAPPERKFRQVTSRLLTLNKAPWLSRGGLSTLARNLSLPEDFDFGEDDFPSSLSEARTSIAQGVLLNPSTMQTEDADGSKPMNRPDISPDSSPKLSCGNVAFPNLADFPSDLTFVNSKQQNSCRQGDHSDSPSKPPGSYVSETSSLRSMWFLDKAAVPASYRQSDARLRGKRWDLTSATDVPRDVCVAVTSSSVSPPYVHPLGMSYFSSRETRVPGKGFLLHNGPFGEHREENHSRHHRGRVGRFPPMPSSSVRNVQKDYNYRAHRSGSVHKMSDHAWNEVPLLAESYAENGTPLQTYGISAGFDPLADHDENPYAQDDSFHTDEVHASGIDEMNGENYMFCDSQNRRLLSYYKSLEDGEIRPPKRFPMPQRINGKDYNPMLPVETHFTHPNPPFLPAAFSPQFFTDSQDVTQEDPLLPSNAPVKRRESIPLNPVVPSRRSRLVSTGTIPSQLRPKLPNSFCHSRARNRGVLKKSSSTQSTRTLISGIPSPTHSFGSFSSELPPSAQPQGFISSQDNPEHPLTPTTPISHGDTVPDSPHTARLLGQEGLADDSPLWLTSDDDTKHSRRSPLASQLSDLTSWGLSDSSRRVKDVQQGQPEAPVSSGSPSSSADGWTNMRQASHVHRLPRFQVRCGMNRLLAQHATATDVKTRGEDCFTMEAHQQQDSLWAKEPPHTQI